MINEPRKASDILLALESQMQQLIAIYRNQDLVLKVLANKLNSLIETVNNLSLSNNEDIISNKSSSELYNPHPIPVNVVGEFKLPVEVAPKGFRRTSRPETYDLDTSNQLSTIKQNTVQPVIQPLNTKNNSINTVNLPVQFPDFDEVQSEPVAPPNIIPENKKTILTQNNESKIPVQQRIVDKNGKAIFLANIEIINTINGDSEFKGRTNGIGKWQASLKPGRYKVKIDKQESLSKGKIELIQDITIDGLSPTQELPVLICR